MKRSGSLLLVTIVCLLCNMPLNVFAQKQEDGLIRCEADWSTAFSKRNYQYVDSAEQVTKRYLCNGVITYPAKYEPKKMKRDLKIVDVLNAVFQQGFTIGKLDAELKKVHGLRVSRSENVNGLISTIQIVVNGNYIRVELKLDCVDDWIINRRCLLNSTTNCRCNKVGYRVADFNLLKTYFVKEFDFLIAIRDQADFIAADCSKSAVRKVAGRHTDFVFSLPDIANESWVNNILTNQYNSDSSCCYSHSTADKHFVELIRKEKLDVIKALLYSPDYLYSVNAMEALLYLASINKVVIDEPMQQKIELIKQGNYNIKVQRSYDVFTTVAGYRKLLVTDAGLIDKYQRALR